MNLVRVVASTPNSLVSNSDTDSNANTNANSKPAHTVTFRQPAPITKRVSKTMMKRGSTKLDSKRQKIHQMMGERNKQHGYTRSKSSRNLFETEEILSKIIQTPGKQFSLFLAGILFVSAMAGAQTVFQNLSGHISYQLWDCLGDNVTNPACFNATQGLPRETNPEIYNKSTMCDNELKAGLHFMWNCSDVNYYSVEWGLYCDKTYLKEIVVQMFFVGSALGTVIAWFLYDWMGRRTSALIGIVIAMTISMVAAFSPNAYIMAIQRFLLGMAMFIYYTAVYIYLMEIVPPKFRVILSTLYMILWSIGYLISVAIFITAKNWGTLMSTMSLLSVISVIPLLYGPDSPRFKLVTLRREAEARKELELLFNINGEKFQFNEFKAALTFHEQRMDEITGINILKLHPKFVRELLIMIVLWFVVGFSYYGFSYSFNALSTEISISTAYGAAGEIVSNLLAVAPLIYLGRKWSCQLFFLAAGASFVLMMFPFPPIGGFKMQDLFALLGNMAVSGAFSSLYLYTFELTPTTHRGRIFNICQFACRIGSFLGAKSSSLYDANKHLALLVFAVMTGVCFVLLFIMPRTKGIPTPDVPIEVERRSSRYQSQRVDG